MQAYSYPIEQAIVQFPIVAILFTIPYMFYNYRKYGSVYLFRSFVLFSFVLYLQCAYYLVILPLPDRASVVNKTGPFMQLIPFNFVGEFFSKTTLQLFNVSTYLPAIKQGVFLQPLFNVVITIPFGVYLHYYFRANWKKVLIFTFLLSLFFEITQLTGLYGFYAKPYRLFDVDDLMLNTAGGMLGYLVSRYLTFFLPSREKIDQKAYEKSLKVTYTRRFFAFMIDWVVLATLVLLVGVFVQSALLSVAIELLYFIGLQAYRNGKTLGKWFVQIKTTMVDTEKPLLLGLIKKYGSVYAILLFLQFSNNFSDITKGISNIAAFLLVVFLFFFIPIDYIKSFKRGRRTWYEMFSGTQNTSTVKAPQTDIPEEVEPVQG